MQQVNILIACTKGVGYTRIHAISGLSFVRAAVGYAVLLRKMLKKVEDNGHTFLLNPLCCSEPFIGTAFVAVDAHTDLSTDAVTQLKYFIVKKLSPCVSVHIQTCLILTASQAGKNKPVW